MNMKKRWLLVILALLVLTLVSASVRAADLNKSKDKEGEELAATPVESPSKYDTSALEAWCGEPKGTVRMTAGWYSALDTIETEDGNLWELNTEDIPEYALLLIWFDDMGTPEIEDDQIIKVWQEIYS